MWVGLSQSVEGLMEKDRASLRKIQEFCLWTAFKLKIQHQVPWVSGLLACPAEFNLLALTVVWTNSLPVHTCACARTHTLSLSFSVSLSLPPYVCTHPMDSVSLENPNTIFDNILAGGRSGGMSVPHPQSFIAQLKPGLQSSSIPQHPPVSFNLLLPEIWTEESKAQWEAGVSPLKA